jgi:hypothetical protein
MSSDEPPSQKLEPFRITIADDVTDLKTRLAATRWPGSCRAHPGSVVCRPTPRQLTDFLRDGAVICDLEVEPAPRHRRF